MAAAAAASVALAAAASAWTASASGSFPDICRTVQACQSPSGLASHGGTFESAANSQLTSTIKTACQGHTMMGISAVAICGQSV